MDEQQPQAGIQQNQTITADEYIKKLHEKIGRLTMQLEIIQAELIQKLQQEAK